ncbi:MAG: M20/M25/M40 family metallo-hydrolase [Clostridiales bacterium]|nr:M20/M25/M40 family metallo-hydrolase [Clostridiales bacterium]
MRDLEPKDVFAYFDDICGIPHGSGNTRQISDYCVRFARAHGLRYRQEPCGNVIIWKDASPGCEDAPVVMLQGHMDMVAVRTDECTIDPETEGILPAVTEDGQWVYAEGTSLGGDDGIAIAYALAILADDSLRHPPLEAVFTVDEEIGLLGAAALDASDLHSRILLNMDSEDDGIFLTSCAGGATVECFVPAPREEKIVEPSERSFSASVDVRRSFCEKGNDLPGDPAGEKKKDCRTLPGGEKNIMYEWKVSGLRGGHSGTEIHLERANANLLFGRFLAQVGEKVSFSVADLSGGEKDNAIPNRCRAALVVSAEEAAALECAASEFSEIIRAEYGTIEPDMEMGLTRIHGISETDGCSDRHYILSDSSSDRHEILSDHSSGRHDILSGAASGKMFRPDSADFCGKDDTKEFFCERVLTREAMRSLTALLEHLPSGIQRWMPEIPGMVRTSLNLGVLKLTGDEISITFSVRSASRTEKEWLIRRIRDMTELVGGRCAVSGDYPAWEYRADSRIQKIMAETWEEITGEELVLTGIHAGVECGILSEKLPGIDCISYGPQMEDIHTVRERLNIASVERNYVLTVRVLEKLTK